MKHSICWRGDVLKIKIKRIQIHRVRHLLHLRKPFLTIKPTYPRMAFYLFCTSEMSQTLLWILLQKLTNQIFCLFAYLRVSGKLYLFKEDSFLSFSIKRVWLVKRRAAHQHLKEEGSHTIKIDFERMSLSSKNFRTHVLKTTTKGVTFIFGFFCQSKICNFDVAFHIKHNVFRFEVAIDDLLRVKILDCQQNFYKIFFGCLFFKPDDFSLEMK